MNRDFKPDDVEILMKLQDNKWARENSVKGFQDQAFATFGLGSDGQLYFNGQITGQLYPDSWVNVKSLPIDYTKMCEFSDIFPSNVFSETESFMRVAYEMATYSPDPSTQNGAVLVNREGTIIGAGWNDFPVGVDDKYWHGEKADKYARVVHAEVSAILSAAQNGFSTVDTFLFCPWAACSNCAKHIAAAGVTYLIRHPWKDGTTGNHWADECALGDEILTEANITIVEVQPFKTETKIRRNGAIWNPTGE